MTVWINGVKDNPIPWAITTVTAVVFVVLIGGAAGHRDLTDDQYRTAKTGASDYATKAGMTLLSCYGTDWNSKGRAICTLRTYTGAEYYLKCTYNQEGCIPATYKE